MKKYIILCFAVLFSVIGAKADIATGVVSVENVTMNAGETTTVAISLTSNYTGYVSFQMDLTLPDGVTINKAGCSLTNRITDTDQELTIGKQDDNVYRLTSTSFALTPITGTSGELIILSLSATEESDGGQATLKNIRFATANSERVTMGNASFNITVVKPLAVIVTAPTAKTLTFSGSLQELITAGEASGGTMQYSKTGTYYSTQIPTEYSAGTYTVYYKAVGDSRHWDSEAGSVSVTISKADAVITTAPTARTLTYTGNAQGLVNNGSVTGGRLWYSLDGTTYSTSIPTGIAVGDYTVYYKVVGDANHNDIEPETINVTINKAPSVVVTAPMANTLTYTGSAQELITAGVANGGTMLYSLNGTTYSTSIPTATEVGSYTVYYKVEGDANHLDIEPATLSVTIAEAQPVVVDVTDISQMDNVIYVEPMEARTGTESVISFKMKNSAEIRGFQFDLYLPQGVTVVKSSKGRIQGALSAGRLPDEDEHTLTFSEHDGFIRFLCGSQYDETFTGNDGEIATLRVNIGEEMEEGDHALQLKDMKLTETDISKFYETALVQSKLTVYAYVTGDISGDGVVDVSDYTGVANHIHGNTPEGFNAKAADVDQNNVIDVSDYTGIANIIHTGSIYGNNSSNAPGMLLSPKRVNTDLSTYDNVIYISPFTASANSQISLSIKMKNTAEIRGFQFDLYLPQGVTVVKSEKGRIQGSLSPGRLPDEDEHELTFSEHDGFIRFLCGSQYDETFTGNDGEIATLKVNIAEDMEAGDHAIQMKNMKLTETDISKFYTAELIETTVTIGGQGSYVMGDVNSDGDVDTQDAIKVIQHYLGKNPTDFNAQAADVNGDGDIDTQDAILIIKKYLNK